MNSPKIISIGFAVPENSYTQEEMFQVLGYPQRFWRVFKESGIEKRHLWMPPDVAMKASWQQQQDSYRAGAVEVSLRAIKECLDGHSAGDIACVVYGSCTGFAPGPTVAHYLAEKLGLRPSTYYTNIIGQGCESGFPGLRRAYDFAVATGKKPWSSTASSAHALTTRIPGIDRILRITMNCSAVMPSSPMPPPAPW